MREKKFECELSFFSQRLQWTMIILPQNEPNKCSKHEILLTKHKTTNVELSPKIAFYSLFFRLLVFKNKFQASYTQV